MVGVFFVVDNNQCRDDGRTMDDAFASTVLFGVLDFGSRADGDHNSLDDVVWRAGFRRFQSHDLRLLAHCLLRRRILPGPLAVSHRPRHAMDGRRPDPIHRRQVVAVDTIGGWAKTDSSAARDVQQGNSSSRVEPACRRPAAYCATCNVGAVVVGKESRGICARGVAANDLDALARDARARWMCRRGRGTQTRHVRVAALPAGVARLAIRGESVCHPGIGGCARDGCADHNYASQSRGGTS